MKKSQALRSPLDAVTAASEDDKETKQTTTAALSNDAPEVCPICKQPMRPVLANGIEAVVCMHDRVCLPRVDK
ncbi:hypothetical protein GR7B_00064 [Vibrio phage vB_VcorM_GR7B]|nr:hypothetical protein GR7B_00064 [Vibrio phage vB_VcorM_GR7B]